MPRYFSSIKSSLRKFFVHAKTPVAAGLFVQVFGERLGETVGEGFDHDGVVVVVVLFVFLHQFQAAEAGRDGKRPEVIGHGPNRPARHSRPGCEKTFAPRVPIAGAASASGRRSRGPVVIGDR